MTAVLRRLLVVVACGGLVGGTVVVGLWFHFDVAYGWIWGQHSFRAPDGIDQLVEDGRVLLFAGRPRDALPLFIEARRRRSDTLLVHVMVVKTQMELGLIEAALESIEVGLERFPESWSLWEKRGDIAAALGSYEEARLAYAECVSRRPSGYWEPWFKLARVQEMLGYDQDARSTYIDLLKAFPENEEARAALEKLNIEGSHPGIAPPS